MIRDLACRQLLAHGPDVIAPFNSSATGGLSAETGLSITFLDAGLLGTEVENQVVTLDVAVMRRRSAIWAERDSAYIYIKTCTTQDGDRNNALASGVDGVGGAAGLDVDVHRQASKDFQLINGCAQVGDRQLNKSCGNLGKAGFQSLRAINDAAETDT